MGGGLLAFEEEFKGSLCGEIVFQIFFYCFVAEEFSFESSACFNFIYLFDNLEMLRIWSTLVGMQYSRCQVLIFIVWVVVTNRKKRKKSLGSGHPMLTFRFVE